jgi:hypothetical protein
MKNIKNFIVLLFVLFTIPTIAQTTTTFTISPNPGTTPHPSSSEPYKVKKEIEDEDGNFSGNTTWHATFQAAFDFVKSNASGADIVFDGVNGTINYPSVNTLNCKSLKLSNGSSITLNNLDATVTNSVNINSGTLSLNNLTCSGTVTVGGTLNITTSGEFGYLTVNGKVYTHNLEINNNIRVNDNGVLKVSGNATINGTKNFSTNSIVIGISRNFDLDLALTGGFWNLIGFPNDNGITTIANQTDADGTLIPDIWALAFDYSNNNWGSTYISSNVEGTKRGKGFLAFPDIDDNTTHNIDLKITSENDDLSLPYEGTAVSNSTSWFALANPFTQRISVEKFLSKNTVQGTRVYVDNGDSYSEKTAGVIEPLQGFFVNIHSSHTSINFKLDSIFYQLQGKSETTTNNEIVLDVVTGEHAVALSFAENEAALTEYDIFDADKMFGTGAVAEPYFTLGEKTLCHQVVNTLPYVAPMNIRSGEARDIKIVASDIPEQYEVILKDGEEEIALEQGSIYETLVVSGENEDRFQVIINKKNGVSISDVENVSETSISQYNRNIIIEGGNNIHTEIFNMLGQKVYETSSRNFTLNNANAGTYVVKVKDGNSVNTTKIVIK